MAMTRPRTRVVDHAHWMQRDRERLQSAQERLQQIEAGSLPLRLELQQLDAKIYQLQVERAKLMRKVKDAEKGAFQLRDEIAGLLIHHGSTTL